MPKTITLAFMLICLCSSTAFALRINDEAPLFSLRKSNGDFFHLSAHVGSKNKKPAKGVIVNFFSSICKPCRKELPILNSLVDEFEAKGVKVIVIGYKEDFDKISGMLDSINVNKPIALSDAYGKVGEKYGVYGLPLTVFIDAEGRVRDILKGEIPDIGNVLKEKVNRLLQ